MGASSKLVGTLGEDPLVRFWFPRPESAFQKNLGRRCHALPYLPVACPQEVLLGISPKALVLQPWQMSCVGLGDVGRGSSGGKKRNTQQNWRTLPSSMVTAIHPWLWGAGRWGGACPPAPQGLSLCQLQEQFPLLPAPLAGTLDEQMNVGSRWAQLMPVDGFMFSQW